jgi:CheY-like chemotaxis protein
MALSILFVDDDNVISTLSKRVLAEAGHTVFLATTGREALAMLKSAAPDLVITDLVMPDMDGLELIRTLLQSSPALKIIAISGEFQGEFLRVAKAFGAKASLQKLFDPLELLRLVNEVATSEKREAT